MAKLYNPTILGGKEKTMNWVETHRTEIEEIAEGAYNESNSGQGFGGVDEFGLGKLNNIDEENIGPALVIMNAIREMYGITEKDVELFLKQNKLTIQEVFQWEPEKLKKTIEKFIADKNQKKGGPR